MMAARESRWRVRVGLTCNSATRDVYIRVYDVSVVFSDNMFKGKGPHGGGRNTRLDFAGWCMSAPPRQDHDNDHDYIAPTRQTGAPVNTLGSIKPAAPNSVQRPTIFFSLTLSSL